MAIRLPRRLPPPTAEADLTTSRARTQRRGLAQGSGWLTRNAGRPGRIIGHVVVEFLADGCQAPSGNGGPRAQTA